eukprot:GHVN01089023.1.p1 GENE.GHVN01089023.1~~GHVN01089023.1.p1  ORF type:complete len:410 (+),score=75.86 GHVN01089023.1:2473-3702(+)
MNEKTLDRLNFLLPIYWFQDIDGVFTGSPHYLNTLKVIVSERDSPRCVKSITWRYWYPFRQLLDYGTPRDSQLASSPHYFAAASIVVSATTTTPSPPQSAAPLSGMSYEAGAGVEVRRFKSNQHQQGQDLVSMLVGGKLGELVVEFIRDGLGGQGYTVSVTVDQPISFPPGSGSPPSNPRNLLSSVVGLSHPSNLVSKHSSIPSPKPSAKPAAELFVVDIVVLSNISQYDVDAAMRKLIELCDTHSQHELRAATSTLPSTSPLASKALTLVLASVQYPLPPSPPAESDSLQKGLSGMDRPLFVTQLPEWSHQDSASEVSEGFSHKEDTVSETHSESQQNSTTSIGRPTPSKEKSTGSEKQCVDILLSMSPQVVVSYGDGCVVVEGCAVWRDVEQGEALAGGLMWVVWVT